MSNPKTTKSGIATTEAGTRHIPSSTRADGSVRKEIRVRPGYRPPEDVEIYKNKTADAWKTRGKGGVPGAQFVKETKEKSKPKPKLKDTEAETEQIAAPELQPEPLDPEAEKEKEAKKLAKKLRQAKELQQKEADGGALLPEQFQKVIRINELIRQLDVLGFDVEGQRKEP